MEEYTKIKNRRIKRVLLITAIILLAGGLYALLVTLAGISIPCVYHSLFGIWCPGCGSSRMFISLLQLDFRGAFLMNPFLFIVHPIFVVATLFRAYQYITQKEKKQTRWYIVFALICLFAFAIFGALRNFDSFSFLAPSY
ncbi:MAG: DUF2752 domain-containing protein [Ruminococcus sp.]|nr:DUF2752 domain-containing protein [Ruminococcus sp.]